MHWEAGTAYLGKSPIDDKAGIAPIRGSPGGRANAR